MTIGALVTHVPRPSVTFTDFDPTLANGFTDNFSGKLSMIQQVCGQAAIVAVSVLGTTPSTKRMPLPFAGLQACMSRHACARAMLAVANPATNKIAIQRTDTQRKRSHMIPR